MEDTTTTTDDAKLKELRERLAAAKEKRLAAETKLEEQREPRRLMAAIELEERFEKEAGIIAELEKKHGPLKEKLWRVDSPTGMVVLEAPNWLKYRKFQELRDPSMAQVEELVKPCVVYPDKAALNVIIETHYGTLNHMLDAVTYLAGHRKKNVIEGK